MHRVLAMIETDGPGGAETVCAQVLAGLDQSRWHAVAILPGRGWLYDQLVSNGVETIVLPERHAFDVGFLWRVRQIIRDRRIDLIHGHLFGSAVRAGLLARLTNIPAVATLHGMADLAPAERFLALKLAILRAGLDRLVMVSPQLRDAFLSRVRLPSDRVVVIPNGINVERFDATRDPQFRRSLNIGDDEFVVGSVGNLNAEKGFDVLLEAAALLKASGRQYRFVIVGDVNGRQSAELMALRQHLGLTEDVIFTGFRSDVPQALTAFDVYALSSRSEGFSISLVEAMAAGLPVVATRCGGPEHIVSDQITGLLVENSSPKALADGITRFHDDRQSARRVGAAARRDVQGRFGVAPQIQSYERLYEECITAHSGVHGD
jgi:glycosyltransferase involved in cell wall biosynthesis